MLNINDKVIRRGEVQTIVRLTLSQAITDKGIRLHNKDADYYCQVGEIAIWFKFTD